MHHRTIALPPGKYRRMQRLADADGRFSMLAIDQRGSLRRMLHEVDAEAEAEGLRCIKRVVTEAVAPLATAVLTDPLYGYDASLDVLPRDVGVLLAIEKTGYEAAGDAERLSRLLDDWSVDDLARVGADAVKLLLWHHPEAAPDVHRHQQEIVEAVGVACRAAEMPFVLEIVTYGIGGRDAKGADFARGKPDFVRHAAETYAGPRFGVDLFKLEFPANLKYTAEYRDAPFGRDETVYDRAAVEAACAAVDAAATAPWVILSAGVDPVEFEENVRLANAAGASGFLCGRAVWKHVVDHYPDMDAMRAYMAGPARGYFERMVAANAGARPWHRHPAFRAVADPA